MSAIPRTLVQTGRDTLEQCPSAQRWQQSQDQLTYCYFDDGHVAQDRLDAGGRAAACSISPAVGGLWADP